jgi:hypothetical protein
MSHSTTAASQPPTLHRAKRIAFRILTLFLVWAVLEVGGFLLYWLVAGHPFSWAAMQDRRRERASRPVGADASVFAQIHPYVGYVEEPGGESGVRRLVDGRRVPISEFGYIDDKTPIQARGPDHIVVGITGGSVASYFAVNGTWRLEAELSKDPSFAGKRFVFVNLALGGYKQPQQLATLAYLMTLGAEFDLILNIDGFNEVALYELENAGHHVFPAFPRNWHARVGVSDPLLGLTRGRLLVIDEQRTDLARWCSRVPWRYSIICNLFWEFRDWRLGWDSFRIVEASQASRRSRGPYAVTGPPKEFATREESYQHLAAIWANSSSLMHQLCRGRGTRYYHFLQPNQYVADSKPMAEAEKRVAILAEHPYRRGVELGYPQLRMAARALESQGVSYHDLTGIFGDHPEAIYSDGCCHYNQTGYDLMAQAISIAILNDPGTKE